jgi:hypothetical protein
MAAKTLRAVAPNEKAPSKPRPKPPTTVAQAVETGTQRDQLVAMRARIAKAIDDPNIRGADLAALSRRLLEIGREVDALDVADKQEAKENAEASPDEAFDASAV